MKKDGDTFSKGDPYVLVKMGSKSDRTKVHDGGGKNPEWKNEFLYFELENEKKIEIEVFDDDPASDDFLAKATILLKFSHPVHGLVSEGWPVALRRPL